MKTPSAVIFPLILRSAEQETPIPTGQLAACRGKRITRTSWAKYFPPNCAPIPDWQHMSYTRFSQVESRNARPVGDPLVGSPSRYPVEASFTVFRFISA